MDNVEKPIKVNKYKGMGKGKKEYAKTIVKAYLGIKELVSFSESRNALIIDTDAETFKVLRTKVLALEPNFSVVKKKR